MPHGAELSTDLGENHESMTALLGGPLEMSETLLKVEFELMIFDGAHLRCMTKKMVYELFEFGLILLPERNILSIDTEG